MFVKVFLALFACTLALAHEPLSQELVDFVNSQPGVTWTAGHNDHFKGVPLKVLKGMMGVKVVGDKPYRLPVQRVAKPMAIPDTFDSRQQWPNCKSIKEIRDQAACGSCWAFGAVESMSDRICITSDGKDQPHISAENLMTCCKGLIFGCGEGCNGGEPSRAWRYFEQTGIVTGSNYTMKQGCQPYEIPPCDHHTTGRFQPCGDSQKTPACSKDCQSGYTTSYDNDKWYGSSSYSVPSDVESIQKEIMTNGPVEGAFSVYSDFPSYKSGVYQHTTGSYLGGHAIRIIGWGTENNTPYWLIANSWNTDWGMDGWFKMIRGKDDCGIESGIVAGMAKINRISKRPVDH